MGELDNGKAYLYCLSVVVGKSLYSLYLESNLAEVSFAQLPELLAEGGVLLKRL